MKQTNKHKQLLRQKLIRYIDFLLSKSHIEMKSTLCVYKTKLDMDDCLTKSEFNTLLKYLVRDSNRNKQQLTKYFSPVVISKPINTSKEETADLSAFFDEDNTQEIRH